MRRDAAAVIVGVVVATFVAAVVVVAVVVVVTVVSERYALIDEHLVAVYNKVDKTLTLY